MLASTASLQHCQQPAAAGSAAGQQQQQSQTSNSLAHQLPQQARFRWEDPLPGNTVTGVAQAAIQLLKAEGVPHNTAVSKVKALLMSCPPADKVKWLERGAVQLADAVKMTL